MLPESLLRSILVLDPTDPAADLSLNLYALRSELNPEGIDSDIVRFVGDLFDKSQQVPHFDLLVQWFEDLKAAGDGRGLAGLTRIQGLPAFPFKGGPEFRYELDQYKLTLMTDTMGRLLVETSNILSVGLTRDVLVNGRRQKQTLQGPDAALDYLTASLGELNFTLKRGSAEGSFRADASQSYQAYERRRDNPLLRHGLLSGLRAIDVVHGGLRPGDLALVLGFVAHMKSSFVLNWLYKAAVWYGKNVAIASLEMSKDALRDKLCLMHSTHKKFEGASGLITLDAMKVAGGVLSPEEENFFKMVIRDFETCPDYGEIFYKEPQETVTVNDIGRWAEQRHRSHPLDLLVIDYLGLIDPSKHMSGMESGANLNRVIRQAKLLALSFGNGRGIPILSPFQANREGLKEANKHGGKYQLTALSLANEAERSSDLVYYLYLNDQLRASRDLIVGNLKTRNVPLFLDPFEAFADPTTGLIDNKDQSDPRQQSNIMSGMV